MDLCSNILFLGCFLLYCLMCWFLSSTNKQSDFIWLILKFLLAIKWKLSIYKIKKKKWSKVCLSIYSYSCIFFINDQKITNLYLIIENMHWLYINKHFNDLEFYQIVPLQESLYMYYILLNYWKHVRREKIISFNSKLTLLLCSCTGLWT